MTEELRGVLRLALLGCVTFDACRMYTQKDCTHKMAAARNRLTAPSIIPQDCFNANRADLLLLH